MGSDLELVCIHGWPDCRFYSVDFFRHSHEYRLVDSGWRYILNSKPITMKLPLIALFVIIGSQAWSQQPPPPPPQDGPRPLSGSPGSGIKSESLFPPELVMRNQKAIDLTLDQQAAIRAEMVKTLPRFTDLQWQLSSEEETLDAFLKLSRPDEKNVLLQLDKVLAIENEMKHLQLGMMLKMKLILSPDQQNRLRELRKQGQRQGMPPPPPRPEDQ